MGNNFVVSCCSTVDISEELLKQKGIEYICFNFQINDDIYPDDLGKTVSYPEFYQMMREGADTRTSAVNIEQFKEYFEGFAKKGQDVIHLCLSSGLSCSYNNARLAAEEVKEEYPEVKIEVVDSLGASSGSGMLAVLCAEKRNSGATFEQTVEYLKSIVLNMHYWFFSTDLTFYVKGGRVSKAAGLFGGILNICPVLNCDKDGKLIPRKKVRGRKAAIKETLNMMLTHAQNGENYSGKCYISHSDCEEDALALAGLIEQTFKSLDGRVELFSIGTTIGSHTGPGTVALFFEGDKRVD